MPLYGGKLSGMPASNLLSDKAVQAAIKSAKSAPKPITVSDGGGLTLICQPDGGGWWRLRYWMDSRENRLSLGTYPEVSLADARKRRDDARKLIAAKIDPSHERKADKAARATRAKDKALADAGLPGLGTFEHVARDWLKMVHEPKVSDGHSERTRIRFEQDVFPWLGRRQLGKIESPELLECLRRIESRGAIETAHRVKDACGQVFRFGIASGLCQRNPATDLKDALRPVPTRHHAAIVDPKQAGSPREQRDLHAAIVQSPNGRNLPIPRHALKVRRSAGVQRRPAPPWGSNGLLLL